MKWLILLHVLGACVWAGGHLILVVGFLPEAMRRRDPSIIVDFEKGYEKLGIPALLLQVVTGVWMALNYVPFRQWWTISSIHHGYLWIKIILLLATIGFAIHARFFLIPSLTPARLPALAMHIVATTILAVLFVVTGLSFRFGII